MDRRATSITRARRSGSGARHAGLPDLAQAVAASADRVPAPVPVELPIAAEQVLYGLLAIIAMLLFSAAVGMVAWLGFGQESLWGLRGLFDLSKENNIPTYFSALQLIIAAVLLGVITRHQILIQSGWRWHFLILAVGFALLSIDEVASIHEKILGRLGRLLLGDTFYFNWLGPGIVIVVLVALFYLRFLLALPRRFQMLFAASGALFLGGAVAAESVGSEIARQQPGNEALWAYQAQVIVEEGLEMVGIALFIYALLIYLAEARIGLVAWVRS